MNLNRTLSSLLFFIALLMTQTSYAQIWSEDFNSYADGTFNAPPKWSSYATDCDDPSINTPGESQWGVYSGQFTVNDIEGFPCCSGGIEGGGNDNQWTSEIIDLTGFCDISVSLEVFAVGNFECNDPGAPIFGCSGMTPPDNSHDQVVVDYSLDGGAWMQIGYVCGDGGTGLLTTSGLNGATLQLRFFAACKSNGETYTIDNIVVNGSLGPAPTFDPIGPLCETDPPVNLPSVSNEGVTGTWDVGPTFDPSGQGGNIVTITFTPDPSFCNEETTMDITVNNETVPSPPAIGPFCETDPSTPLLTNIGGVDGTWSGPGVLSNEFNPDIAGAGSHTLTFTPDPNQCAMSAGLLVEVNSPNTPVLGTENFCDNDPVYDLTLLEDPLYAGGTWTGPGVSGNMFDPTGQFGTITLTFISNVACTNIATTDVMVDMAAVPVLMSATVCENSGLLDLVTLQDPSYPLGDWSGPGVTGTTFNPSGQAGNNVLTFTSTQTCVAPATTTVTVDVPVTPTLMTATVCENDDPFDLTTLEDPMYPGGNWIGPGVSGTTFDPSGLNGLIELNYEPTQPCVETTTTTIFVEPPGTPNLGDTTLCESAGLFDLNLLADPLFPTGDWSGPNVSGNEFDPLGQSGPVAITFEPSSSCAFTATTFITVDVAGTPNLGSATLCQSDPPFDLTTLEDPDFPNGTWSGDGVSGTEFDPDGLSGNITLTYTPTGICVAVETTTIAVNIPGTPALDTAALCETDGLFNLTNIADPDFPAGTWSGDGVTGNNFDPSGLSGNIPLTFIPTTACANEGDTHITVNETAQPNLGTASICQNNGLFDLNDIADTNYPSGTWEGSGVTGSNFNPVNQSGIVEIIFTPADDCTTPDTTEIEVFLAPAFSNLDEDCDPTTQEFTVSFDISGSNSPFTVDGIVVSGNSFTSTPLPSGTNYSFELNDAEGCGPVTISGSANCLCATDAGNMDFTNSPLLLCDGSDITVVHEQDEFLDPDDNLIFVLHTNAGAQLGTVLSTSTTITVPYPMTGITLGTTYYVSAVAGNDDGSGGVDLNDPCLSVAQGIPVSFYFPSVQLNAPTSICADECFGFTLQLSGVSPFIIDYAINWPGGGNGIQNTEFNVSSPHTINFCPADHGLEQDSATIIIYNIEDGAGCDVQLPQDSIHTVLYIDEAAEIELEPTLCPGESVVVNGNIYDENTPTGTEVFVGGSMNGCDSTVNISLSYFTADTTFFTDVLCTGSSIIVNGETYDEGNPDGIETVIAGNVNGCDSIISVDLTFNDEVFENLEPTLCPGGSITVNGTIYDSGNPSGSETFPNGSLLGCDSTVLINLSFYPPASANLSPELCSGGSITINGEVYDENNPSGTEIIAGGSFNGCDSTININLNFTDEVTFDLTPTLCPSGSVIVNGNTYDEDTPTGQEVFTGGSVLGCDSVVNISLGFYNEAAELIEDQFCNGGFIVVNGTIYDETNPGGTEVIIGGSVNGCDSTIVVDLEFGNSVFEDVNTTLCQGESINVNGNIYDENTPSGTETIPNGSVDGCDSIINVSLGFYPPNVVDVIETLCPGGSININGTIYDEDNEDGQEILLNADVNGCDSIMDIAIDFHLPATGIFDQQICTGSSVTINGNIYDESNPTGTEILPAASIYGCDSTVTIDLSFTNAVLNEIEETLCPGESITVNGVVYDENNPSGNETIMGGSAFGCDSIIDVQLDFFPDAIGIIEEMLGPGGSVTVNGTVYNQNNPSGTEVLVGQSQYGCDSTVFINLMFEVVEILVTYQANSTSCEFGSDGSIIIESITGGEPPYTIALNGGNSEIVALFPFEFDNLENGFYTLTVLDAVGNLHTEEIFLPFPDPPLFELGDDIFLDLGESVTLAPELDFQPASYIWEPDTYLDCNDCEMPVSTPSNDINYTLTVTDQNGCSYTDDVTIFVQKARNVFGPNAFSPNNDARNDEFTLFAGGQVAQIKSLLIFDRWGNLMFEQFNFPPNNLSIGWDGRFNGEMMNPGVYVWFAEVEFVDEQVGLYEGEVTLIR